MNDVEHCLICGAAIPEGAQVCRDCWDKYKVTTPQEAEGVKEQMQDTLNLINDIEDFMSITANNDRNIKKSTEGILRLKHRLEERRNEKKRKNATAVQTGSGAGKIKNGDKL